MLKNYIKTAFRNLHKHKIYSSINVFGLALGITSCILIMLYVNNEWSYDKFHSDSDRIHRAWVLEDYGEGDVYFNTTSPIILKPTLEANIPEVEQVARYASLGDQVKRTDQSESFSESIQMVDTEFFSMFDFKLLRGDKEQLFAQTNEVVISPEVSERYFGSEDPLQKTILIRLDGTFEAYTVTGVLEEAPINSSIQYNMLIPFSKSATVYSPGAQTGWFSVIPETYVKLREGVSSADLDGKLLAMMKQVLGDRYSRSNYQVGLQPITDIHLNTEFPAGIAAVNDPTFSYILAAIAIMVLLIACINFMTLSISSSASRAKEVGIRKSIGAERTHLMYQFWGEAILTTVFALLLGILLSELLLPSFNVLSGTELTMAPNLQNILMFIGLGTFISFVAGIYPAVILSSFRPVEVLKGKFQIKGDKSLFRQGMVVLQFTVSIFLIAGTFAIYNQLEFIRGKDLGFQKDQIIVLQTDVAFSREEGVTGLLNNASQRQQLLETELSGSSGVIEMASSIFTPVQQGWISVDYRDADDATKAFNVNFVNTDYIETMSMNLVEGRNFSEEISSDVRMAIIVNQAFVDDHGWENGVGQKLTGRGFEDHEIIGVVENFNYQSLYNEVEPLALSMNPGLILGGANNVGFSSSPIPRITVKIAGGQVSQTIDAIREAWGKVAPAEEFSFTFLDEAINNQYQQEERLSKIIILGSILAIVIACLGLFGLASLMIARRTKEIGVRKVLGASATGITLLVNREFSKLVLVSFALSIPLVWYGTQFWLENFAYKVDVGPGVYLTAGVMALVIAWLAVSYQTIKAAAVNPVDSLKSE